jgi:hypothetical protein
MDGSVEDEAGFSSNHGHLFQSSFYFLDTIRIIGQYTHNKYTVFLFVFL